MIKSAFLLLPMYVTLMWALVFLFQKKPRIMANKSLGLFMLAASVLYVTHTFFFFQSYHIYSFLESVKNCDNCIIAEVCRNLLQAFF